MSLRGRHVPQFSKSDWVGKEVSGLFQGSSESQWSYSGRHGRI